MFYWLYDIPVLSLVRLFVLIFVGLCCLGIILLSPIIAPWFQDKADLNEVLGDYLQYFGVIYGLLLGLLAVATCIPTWRSVGSGTTQQDHGGSHFLLWQTAHCFVSDSLAIGRVCHCRRCGCELLMHVWRNARSWAVCGRSPASITQKPVPCPCSPRQEC